MDNFFSPSRHYFVFLSRIGNPFCCFYADLCIGRPLTKSSCEFTNNLLGLPYLFERNLN